MRLAFENMVLIALDLPSTGQQTSAYHSTAVCVIATSAIFIFALLTLFPLSLLVLSDGRKYKNARNRLPNLSATRACFNFVYSSSWPQYVAKRKRAARLKCVPMRKHDIQWIYRCIRQSLRTSGSHQVRNMFPLFDLSPFEYLAIQCHTAPWPILATGPRQNKCKYSQPELRSVLVAFRLSFLKKMTLSLPSTTIRFVWMN